MLIQSYTDPRLDYVTIATTGDATNFGNAYHNQQVAGGASGNGKVLFAGGLQYKVPGPGADTVTTIQAVTVATTGNGTFFGNLTAVRYDLAGVSSGHGGIY